VFGREQYETKDKKLRFSTRLSYITSLSELNAGKVSPPKDKMLDGAQASGNKQYNNSHNFVLDDSNSDLPF